jgi:hypothetical protein
MLTRAVFLEQEHRAALHNVDAVVDEGADGLIERKLARLPVEHGKKDHGEAFLHLRVLVELVEHDLWLRAALELDHNAHAVAVAVIGHIRDVVDDLGIHQFCDAFDELRLVHLVGNLGYDDGLFFFVEILNGHLGAHHEAAPAGAIGLGDASLAIDESARGKIGPLNVLEHFFEAGARILHQRNRRVDDLCEVVRRDVGGHADRDARRAVDDEIGKARGQHHRLEGRLVVVRREVDGFHLDVGHQFAGDARHAALGIAHGRRRIAVDGAKVALAVNQRVAKREGLGHADQRVVDGGVAVGMVNTHRLPHHLGALGVLLVVLQAHLGHGVEDPAMDRLETVESAGQSAADDDRHGVIEVRAAHLLLDVDRNEICAAVRRHAAIERKLGILIVGHRVFSCLRKCGGRGSGKSGAGIRGR